MSLQPKYILVSGPPGESGRDGRRGPTGSRGETGPVGEVYYVGETGPTGPTGMAPLFIFGKGAPNPNYMKGSRGDTYINRDDWDVYNYNINWNYLGTLKGGTGSTGPTGCRGQDGITGPTGPSCLCQAVIYPSIPIKYFETTHETITGVRKFLSGEVCINTYISEAFINVCAQGSFLDASTQSPCKAYTNGYISFWLRVGNGLGAQLNVPFRKGDEMWAGSLNKKICLATGVPQTIAANAQIILPNVVCDDNKFVTFYAIVRNTGSQIVSVQVTYINAN